MTNGCLSSTQRLHSRAAHLAQRQAFFHLPSEEMRPNGTDSSLWAAISLFSSLHVLAILHVSVHFLIGCLHTCAHIATICCCLSATVSSICSGTSTSFSVVTSSSRCSSFLHFSTLTFTYLFMQSSLSACLHLYLFVCISAFIIQ